MYGIVSGRGATIESFAEVAVSGVIEVDNVSCHGIRWVYEEKVVCRCRWVCWSVAVIVCLIFSYINEFA